jgi:hypothetical protein
MKFIAAATVLIQSLQTTTSARSLLTREELVDLEHGHIPVGLHRQRKLARSERAEHIHQQQPQQQRQRAGNMGPPAVSRGVLVNTTGTLKRQREEGRPKECSPDQGVLACGLEEYCMESEQSSLGGYCTMSPTVSSSKVHHLRRNAQVSYSTTNATYTTIDRPPYYAYNWTLWKSYYNNFCKPKNYTYYEPFRTCTCSNVDEEAYTLEASCKNIQDSCWEYYSRCGAKVPYCSSYENVVKLEGKEARTTTRCTVNQKPYDQKLCYTVDVVGYSVESCSMEFNGETCNSCTVVTKEGGSSCYDVNGTETCSTWTYTCYEFDCTNTEGQHKGSSCKSEGNKLRKYLNYFDCVKCNICEQAGETGLITLPYGVLETPRLGEQQCFQADFRGRSQYWQTDECAQLQELAADVCGCQVCSA